MIKSKSKLLFFILAVIVLSILCFCGVFFYKINIKIFFLIEICTVLSVIIFVILYQKLIKPYQLLTDSMELIKEQDFSIRLRPITNSEANKLIEIFNKMMDQLRNERLSVREKNYFLDLLIHASPQGVIILDFENRITAVNPTGLRLLRIESLSDIIDKRLDEVDNSICCQLAILPEGEETILRIGGVIQYRCTVSSFLDRGASHPFILIEELTYELLENEKKSYESLIRLMAHEVNNSTGAIGATLNVIADIYNETKWQELTEVMPALTASTERCMHLSAFVSNFAEVVKIPEPLRKEVDMKELLIKISKLCYIDCLRREIELKLNLTDEEFVADIDIVQFEQVILNILKNAYEAIGGNGLIIINTTMNPKKIEIRNNGPELSDMAKENIFTPFFTTKRQGQGIGLMFIREVLLNHKFDFNFYSDKGWTIFEIYL